MSRLINRTLIVLLLLTNSAFGQTGWTPLASVDALNSAFSQRLSSPMSYAQTVSAQAWTFPEGDLFPIVFPLLALINEAIADPPSAPGRRESAALLASMAIAALEARFGLAVEEIKTADGEATYLGQVNLALSGFRLIGGDDRFESQNRHLSEILHRAIVERKGAPMESWPGLLWPFDTLPAVLSLRVRDTALNTHAHDELVRTYLEWMDTNGRDPETGLPASQLNPVTRNFLVGPRGCDLSYRIALLSQLDKQRATKLYHRYVDNHWREGNGWFGFTEYPDGKPGPVDTDSGPILGGLGLAATGFGLAATRAVGDVDRWNTLSIQADQLTSWIQLGLSAGVAPIIPPGIQLEKGYVTGFLIGDAALYWAATFTDWDVGLESNP